jgi:precorrin-4/cobalt-precorrin-4 C11-methyltransferase
VADLAAVAAEHGITKTALILVGDVIGKSGYEKSKLYDETFSTELRKAKR